MPAVDVKLERVTKKFSDTVAVDDFSLEVEHGEFLCLLGPSGCGKTTLLRMLAGLEEPTEGIIYLKGEVVNGVPAYDRDAAMVFQDWALFPHKNVYENIAFGLRMKGVAAEESRKKVAEYLDLVQLPGLENRMPAQLSGGMQQRVALARALIVEPAVLLMDEPLSNLDLKLRQQMRVEIRQIQRRLSITTIFVTHDQMEALELSDRLAVVNRGHIEQVGPPMEVYEAPRSTFVADFLGESNFLEGSITTVNPSTILTTSSGLSMAVRGNSRLEEGAAARLSIRPQLIGISPKGDGPPIHNVFSGRVALQTYLGSVIRYHVDLDDGTRMLVDRQVTPGETLFPVGDEVTIHWPVEASVCFKDTER